jgi:hypothetical protein
MIKVSLIDIGGGCERYKEQDVLLIILQVKGGGTAPR